MEIGLRIWDKENKCWNTENINIQKGKDGVITIEIPEGHILSKKIEGITAKENERLFSGDLLEDEKGRKFMIQDGWSEPLLYYHEVDCKSYTEDIESGLITLEKYETYDKASEHMAEISNMKKIGNKFENEDIWEKDWVCEPIKAR